MRGTSPKSGPAEMERGWGGERAWYAQWRHAKSIRLVRSPPPLCIATGSLPVAHLLPPPAHLLPANPIPFFTGRHHAPYTACRAPNANCLTLGNARPVPEFAT